MFRAMTASSFLSFVKKTQMEHTEGVRKLNFVLSLTNAILEVISARGTPFTVLTDSVAIRQVRILMLFFGCPW